MLFHAWSRNLQGGTTLQSLARPRRDADIAGVSRRAMLTPVRSGRGLTALASCMMLAGKRRKAAKVRQRKRASKDLNNAHPHAACSMQMLHLLRRLRFHLVSLADMHA